MNLKQLAKHLNLSPTTVSRALNGYPEVSEATRARVLAAAKANNYLPSHHASRLAKGKAHAIAHVVPLNEHAMINPHFSDFIAGAGLTYAKAGYDMIMRVAPEADEEKVYRDFAKDGRVDGVIVHGPLVNDGRVALLQDLGLPFVVHGRVLNDESSYSWLDVNNYRAFQRATQFLLDLGHERIALVNGYETMVFAARRRDGYLKALSEAGIEADPDIMFSSEMVEPQGYEAIKQMIDAGNTPTAAMFSSILPALGAMRAIREAGLKPGDDISLIVFDDQLSFLQNSGNIPMFTSLRSSIKDAGTRVAEMLISKINKPDIGHIHELWEAELVLGSSTSRPPEA